MLITLIIGLREYLEVFLIIGIFLGINKQLFLKRDKEIFFGSFLGITLSLLLPIIIFYKSQSLKFLLKQNDIIEGILLIFSGFFISQIIFSIHNLINKNKHKKISQLKNQITNNKEKFDYSLFLLIIFFILREGLEIAFFTSTSNFFYSFLDNLIGLIISFLISIIFGLIIFFGFLKISIKKIYQLTEWLLIFLGGSMIINGINELLEKFFKIEINNFLPIYLGFLPHKDSFFGHFLKTFFTLKQEYSFLYIFLLLIYIFIIKKLLLKK